MCRFVFYSGKPICLSSLIEKPQNSIISQSLSSQYKLSPVNADGFGIAWYAPHLTPEPGMFHAITPAWNNHNLLNLASTISSPTILAHVRAASESLAVSQNNCHPFAWNSFSFMHNGFIKPFLKVKRKIQAHLSDEAFAIIKGSTDSEHIFVLFIHHYLKLELPELDRMETAMVQTIAYLQKLLKTGDMKLNLIVTNGNETIATRYSNNQENPPSLFISSFAKLILKDHKLKELPGSHTPKSVLICSEPITEELKWQEISPNTLIKVKKDNSFTTSAFEG